MDIDGANRANSRHQFSNVEDLQPEVVRWIEGLIFEHTERQLDEGLSFQSV